MMKKHTFIVDLIFSDDLDSSEDAEDIMNNLMEGIYQQTHNQLAPVESGAYTTKISIDCIKYSLHLEKDI